MNKPWQGAAVLALMTTVYAACALGSEPPECTSTRVVSKMRQAYSVWLLDTPKAKFRIEDVRETGYGSAAKGVNLHAPAKDHYNRSRYCEARVVIDGGQTEVGYFRLDGLKNPDDDDYNFALCFASHNTRNDGCVDERAPK
jgi:hypothetical protein